MSTPRLALGPLQYLWSRDETLALYERVADAPVDTVYLGETVCSKRRALGPDDWIALGRTLAAAGKEVVLSTLTLIEARSELGAVRRLCDNGEFALEAGDMSAVGLLSERGLPFVGGPALNVYSAEALAVLADAGLYRWVPPVEMTADSLAALCSDWAEWIGRPMPATELFAVGRIPLAWSARCFTARAHGRPKDDCGFVCGRYPDGLALDTQTGDRFLTLNGIQTQSGRPIDLFGHLERIRSIGVEGLRISPFGGDNLALLRACRDVLDGARRASDVAACLGEPVCDGYWVGTAGRRPASA